MDRPIRNLGLSFSALLVSLWFRPILQRLPAPELPRIQLRSLNGTDQASNSCKVVHHPSNNLKYCEDILHWKDAHVAIVSCDAGRPNWNTVMGPLRNPEPRGKLFVYRTDNTLPNIDQGPHDQTHELELAGFPRREDFHPLGLELFSTHKHTGRLFVVNHRRDRGVIEVFKLRAQPSDIKNPNFLRISLEWERTLVHDLISTPNSIVALSPNSLLVTNDHYFNRRSHPFLHSFETALALRGGNVIEVRFSSESAERVTDSTDQDDSPVQDVEAWKTIEGIPFANGLTLNPSGATLVVACSITHTLWYYHRLKPIESNQRVAFTPVGSRPLNFAPDNIHFDGAKRLIAAGHPHGLSLLKASMDPENSKPAGSSVAAILHQAETEALNPHQTEVRETFVDDGDFFASSTSAILIPQPTRLNNSLDADQVVNKLVVSGLYQTGLLECELT